MMTFIMEIFSTVIINLFLKNLQSLGYSGKVYDRFIKCAEMLSQIPLCDATADLALYAIPISIIQLSPALACLNS
jgi:hypothetical protein